MTSKELAKVCVGVAEKLGMTAYQREDFALEVMKECLLGNQPMSEEDGEATPQSREPRIKVETKPPLLKRQPKEEETPVVEKRASEAPYKLLCRAGTKCGCSVCQRNVFQVSVDVFDGMPAEEFAHCFTPIDHDKRIPIPTRIRAVDGCVMTDCPVCGGDMTLVLWGRRPERDFEDNGVSSTGNLSV